MALILRRLHCLPNLSNLTHSVCWQHLFFEECILFFGDTCENFLRFMKDETRTPGLRVQTG
jgi:hypothetical protein